MLVEGASLSLIETQVLCLPVEFAQRGLAGNAHSTHTDIYQLSLDRSQNNRYLRVRFHSPQHGY